MCEWKIRESGDKFSHLTYYLLAHTPEGQYYCYFSQYRPGDRWTGWIMKSPLDQIGAYIDAATREGAQEFCEWFLSTKGG